jgi:hypothetical protein
MPVNAAPAASNQRPQISGCRGACNVLPWRTMPVTRMLVVAVDAALAGFKLESESVIIRLQQPQIAAPAGDQINPRILRQAPATLSG